MEITDKQCSKCLLEKPLDKFYRHKRGHFYKVCKVCHKARTSENHQKNPHLKRLWNWKTKYGIVGMTEEIYQSMLSEQGGVCKICMGTNPSGRRLPVDHDHETGRIRGLLCTKCNTTIGWIEQNPGIVTYLY